MSDLGNLQETYWRTRALSNDLSPREVSIQDPWQRDIETAFVVSSLGRCGAVLEVGCGNGQMTADIAAIAESVRSIDISDEMIQRAASTSGSTLPNVKFEVRDILDGALPSGVFDAIVCCRVLINMDDRVKQERAVSEFARLLRPGGRLVLIEGRIEAFEAINKARKLCGLGVIQPSPVNLYLDESFMRERVESAFNLVSAFSIGIYDLLTRVVMPATLPANAAIDLETEIKQTMASLFQHWSSSEATAFSRLTGGLYSLKS